MVNEVLTYGVKNQHSNKGEAESHIEELKLNGFTVIQSVFSEETMNETALLLDSLLEKQIEEMGGRANLQSANDDDLIRCPLAYSPHFLEIAKNPKVLDIIRLVLGENIVLLMQNAIINRAEKKQYQVRWHRDLNYQHWTSSHPLAVNFLVCVDRFYKDGGCTWVLPGSHLHEQFPSNEFVIKNEIPLEAEVGSVVLMNAMTFHRSGINVTASYTRHAINHVVGTPFMGQQIDIPRFLAAHNKDYGSDKFLHSYLGYQWNPAPDAKEWRAKRSNKK